MGLLSNLFVTERIEGPLFRFLQIYAFRYVVAQQEILCCCLRVAFMGI